MGRRRAAVIGKGRRRGSGGVPFMLALIGVPVLMLASLFEPSTAPPAPGGTRPVAPSDIAPRYVSLAAQPDASPPAPPPAPSPVMRAAGRTQSVAGGTVALRAEPDARGAILDRYESGQAVEVLGRSGGWTRVRSTLTQREGWIPAKRLRDAPAVLAAEARPQARAAPVTPRLDDAAIATLLIARSIAAYPGPCACPYQSARNGSSCGRRAAYVRPGGYAPLCYAKDVTPDMIAAYRAEH